MTEYNIQIVAKQMKELGYDPVKWGDSQNTFLCKVMQMIAALTLRVQQLEVNSSGRTDITFNTVGE